ncbi:hypothetical protein V3C99_013679 [Haemonchus contortus]
MGATDVLPYPRRRSSIQLEPINFQLPGEVGNGNITSKDPLQRMHRLSINDGPQSSTRGPKSPPMLSPLRVAPRHALSSDQKRSHSSESLMRGRSQSLYRLDRALRGAQSRRPSCQNERPHEARRRVGSENDETAAQFIERFRQDLMSQLHRPQELDVIHSQPTRV